KQGYILDPTDPPKRILRPETAITMRAMMEGVVLRGTAKGRAKLEGYSSAGKTGTAQIFDLRTHHYTHQYNASFMGFAPVTNPALVIVATINGTNGTGGYGGAAAAPVFKAVMTEALRVLDVPKDLPDEAPGQNEKMFLADADDLPMVDLEPSEPNIMEEL